MIFLDFTAAANDTASFNADTLAADTFDFSGNGTTATISESSAGAGDKAAVIAGTVTVLMDPGMSIQTSAPGAGGLFHDASAKIGSSIITLGG